MYDSSGGEAEASPSEMRDSASLKEVYSKDGERRVAEEDARCWNVMLVEADELRKSLLQHVDVVQVEPGRAENNPHGDSKECEGAHRQPRPRRTLSQGQNFTLHGFFSIARGMLVADAMMNLTTQ